MNWFEPLCLVAALIAALATWLELTGKFYMPQTFRRRLKLWGWWWGWTAIHAGLAATIYTILTDNPGWGILNESPDIVRAIAVGSGYLAFIHLSFSDSLGKQKLAFGTGVLHDALRDVVYKKINLRATDALLEEAQRRTAGKTLAQLASEAKQLVDADQLLQDKDGVKEWIDRVCADKNASAEERKNQIGVFLLRRERPGA